MDKAYHPVFWVSIATLIFVPLSSIGRMVNYWSGTRLKAPHVDNSLKSSMFMTPGALELMRGFFFSGVAWRPSTAESTLVSGSDMIGIGVCEVLWGLLVELLCLDKS